MLNRVVSGPTTPEPASFKRRYEIPSGPVEFLLCKDDKIFLTSAADISSYLKVDLQLAGPNGNLSSAGDTFWLMNVSLRKFAFFYHRKSYCLTYPEAEE